MILARLRPGAVIAGRYTLSRRVGEGGMGVVWAAADSQTERAVALKFLKRHAALSTSRRRFLREARTAGSIIHPNVVQIHEVLELEDGAPVMVMELLEGESLASKMAREGSLTLEETARILMTRKTPRPRRSRAAARCWARPATCLRSKRLASMTSITAPTSGLSASLPMNASRVFCRRGQKMSVKS
jgi:hypothetical protein